MPEPVDISPTDLNTVQEILRRYVPEYEVRAFGSRVTWLAKEFSDLDLAIMTDTPLTISRMANLREAFSESILPIKVDLVDWAAIGEGFRKIIEKKYEVVQKPKNVKYENAWEEIPFSEAVLINPSAELKRGEKYPFVDMQAITPGKKNVSESEVRLFKGNGSRFKSFDTLMARITPCLENGKIARYVSSGEEVLAHGSTEFIVIRGKPGVTDNGYAYYLTISPQVYNFAISQMTGSSGRQRVPTDSLNGLSVSIPPIFEQKMIARVLGALDRKIELNQKTNETLETMARALFKSWFVNFDPVRAKSEGRDTCLPKDVSTLFPSEFENSELGQIPKGWNLKTVGDVADILGGTTPSTEEPAFWENGVHCWATPKDLSPLLSPVLLGTERHITDEGLRQIGSGLLRKGTVLLSSRAPIGYLAIAEIPTAINQGFIAIVPKNQVSNLFLFFWVACSLDEIVSRANGSTFLEISKSNFRPIPLVAPPDMVMNEFDRLIRPIYEHIVANEREIQSLSRQRDSLLPKLISGELSVNFGGDN